MAHLLIMNFKSFYNIFIKLATQVYSQAKAINSSADFYFYGNWTDPRIDDIWAKHLDAFNAAIALLPVLGKRIELPFTDGKLRIPAIFYGSGKKEARPTIILGNGYDGGQEEMLHVMGKAILERGMNVITYEGPGQPTVRRKENLGFIHEWEKVVTPVVDYLLTRPEVDPKSIGLLGYSFGGMLAPRAAAFEHRLAPVFAVDDCQEAPFRRLFETHDATTLDSMTRQLLKNPLTPASMRWAIQQAPVFVGSAEDDIFFSGQAKLLVDSLGSKATFKSFGNFDGAGKHCQAGASVFLSQTALNWFAEIVGSHKEYSRHFEVEREL
ncbi:2,6-dihydropseudooxynicotine hydrolase [Fusarium oxysporum]|nr:2,6-dihydropseudooxynicotine hydrolase [Fusarium oxysporum]